MPRHEALPRGADKARAVKDMFDRIAPRYDLVNRVMTFGLDAAWRRRTVAALRLPAGALVADLACGTGDLCRGLADGGMRAMGFDLSAGMLAAARTEAPLVQADILRLPLPDGSVDGATCGFALRNVTDVGSLFGECARVLRPGGRVAFLEVSEPTNPALRAGHRVYFRRVVPLIGAALSDAAAYRYLPASTAYLPPMDALLGLMSDAGFTDVEGRRLFPGAVQLLTGTRP